MIFDAVLSFPLGDNVDAATTASLASTLLSFRCDIAAGTGVALRLVRVTSGVPANASIPLVTILDAILIANAGVACPAPRSRLLLAVGASDARALAAGTAIYATLTSGVGVAGSAISAVAITAAIASATFPLTAASWMPIWGYNAATWAAALGAPPMQVVAGSIAVVISATLSSLPQPAIPAPASLTGQQLGLGLGVGLSLAFIVAASALCITRASPRATRAATQLLVVETDAGAAATLGGGCPSKPALRVGQSHRHASSQFAQASPMP